MPRVQLSYPQRDLNITRSMPTPKRMGDLDNWLKSARAVIPQIPDHSSTDWFVADHMVTEATIIFHLMDSVQDKCAVIIDRRPQL